MQGSCFITHQNTWSCSNECTLSFYSEPQIVNDKVESVKQTQTLSIKGIFNYSDPLQKGTPCFIVLKTDDNKKFGFIGQVRSVSEIQIIINILSKTDKISEILSNITIKN